MGDLTSDIRDRIRDLSSKARTPGDMRVLAAALRDVAYSLDRLADAAQRQGLGVLPGSADGQGLHPTGRPVGGSWYCRWEPPRGEGKAFRRSGQFHIGKALWRALGQPGRLDLTVKGNAWYLTICEFGQGWGVQVQHYTMPRLNIGDDPADAIRLAPGYYVLDQLGPDTKRPNQARLVYYGLTRPSQD